MINITFPDHSVRQYPEGVTSLEIAQSISEGLARNVLAAKVDGEVRDATRPIHKDSVLQLLTWNDTEGKATMWHSSAHLMAEAIEQLYPGVKFGIGPDIENGFYYDMDFQGYAITEEDLKKIEERMLALAREKQTYKRREVSKAEALDYFTKKGDPYKIELISALNDGEITFYESGTFTDLCRGPHLPDTGFIKAVKLLNIAGAYWRGDEKTADADPYLWHHLPEAKGTGRIPGLAGRSKKARSQASGQGTGTIHFFPESGCRPAALAAKRRRVARKARTVPQEGAAQSRLRAGDYTAYREC